MSDSIGSEQILTLAAEVTESISQGNWLKLDRLVSPECVFWYNFDRVGRKWSEVRQKLQGMHSRVQSMRFEKVRVTEIHNGWIQQHCLRMVLKDGTEREVYAVLIVRLDDRSLLSSLEEYLDPAQIAGP